MSRSLKNIRPARNRKHRHHSFSEAGPRIKVHAIDPHVGSEEHQISGGKIWTFDEFQINIRKAGVDQLVGPLVKASTEAVKGFDFPVSLIFIDGAHDYESVKADFEAWFPKVMEGGIVAFHDTTNFEGPQILVRKALFRNPHIRGAVFVRSIAYGEKVNTIPAGAWLTNQFRLGLKFIHDPILNFATKPAVKRWIFPLLGRPLGKQPILSGTSQRTRIKHVMDYFRATGTALEDAVGRTKARAISNRRPIPIAAKLT